MKPAGTPAAINRKAFTPVKIGLAALWAVTFYTPTETAERYKGAWGVQKPLYLTLWGQLPREKTSKIEQYAAHMTNVLGAEG